MDNQYSRSSTNYSRASSVQPPFANSNLHLKVEPKPKYYVNTAVIDQVVTDIKFEKVDGSKNAYSKIKKSRFNWQLNEFDKTGY